LRGKTERGFSRFTCAQTGTGVFFVATNGNDAWSGRIAAPDGSGNDGPFATLPRALAAVREFKAKPGNSAAATEAICLRGGTYF